MSSDTNIPSKRDLLNGDIPTILNGLTNDQIRELLAREDEENRLYRSDKVTLLKAKYPNPPKYIDPKATISEFQWNDKIDTDEWNYVRPVYIDGKYTGKWIPSTGGILNEDYNLALLLSYNGNLVEAKIPTEGGRRRKRQTKVKSSKKRANKRRTRSRK